MVVGNVKSAPAAEESRNHFEKHELAAEDLLNLWKEVRARTSPSYILVIVTGLTLP